MNPGTGYNVPQMARETNSPKNGNNIFTAELITTSARLKEIAYMKERELWEGEVHMGYLTKVKIEV